MDNNRPLVGFNFSVTFLGVDLEKNMDNYFQKVKGIQVTRKVEEIASGGSNNYFFKLPQNLVYDNLILERGYLDVQSPLSQWCRKSLEEGDGEISIKTVVVTLKDYSGKKNVASWSFYGCYPVRWSFSDLQSDQSILAIETIEIAYGHFKKLSN
jgi:phage tail-like protein